MSAKKKVPIKEEHDEYIAQVREYFDTFDKDGDGALSTEELGTVLRALGHHISETELAEFVADIDTDRNGTIEFSEFLTVLSCTTQIEEKDEDILTAFQVLDLDGDGYISAAELRHVLTVLGEVLTDEDVTDMIREADTDGNGKIDYAEFVAAINMK